MPYKDKDKKREYSRQKRLEWRRKHPELDRERNKKYKQKLRIAVLTFYSRGALNCECCGDDHFPFLTIDHISGGGRKHRTDLKNRSGGQLLYIWLIKNNFPAGFRVLCWNCNCGRRLNNNICPHEQEK